ncbi:hypothetical protein GS597_09005 [Synechococcales cyanobacterium C]|uniref:Uncharacterized protein n=1 Tax=Petrachloros mirabilis ULC683 TaxID=2781853 RepID=A0A8K2A810_9CYAN|nr:hypothetical protein [Petrachloros mirabilis]NCJ06640.1 hypothetical protein [Petrachloros mirabilis ULC683]
MSRHERMAELARKARQNAGCDSQRSFAEYLSDQHQLEISYATIQSIESGKITRINPDYWTVLAPMAGYRYEEAIAYIEGKTQEPLSIDRAMRMIDEVPISYLPVLTQRIGKRWAQSINSDSPASTPSA